VDEGHCVGFASERGKHSSSWSLQPWPKDVVPLVCGFRVGVYRHRLHDVFSAEAVNWATLIHSACGILMLIALVVHVWMACWIEGSITGMLYGKVSKAWARKHHPAMLNEHEDN
jgi:formate dehydrogenase gamma subunit